MTAAFLKNGRMALANLIGPLLINRFVGTIAGRLTGQMIPYRGLRVDTSSPLITDNSRAALLWRSYERAEYAFVERYLPGDCDAVELGSSIGVMSSIIAQRLMPGRTLRAVEADERLVPVLHRNLALNRLEARVTVINAALGYGSASVEFGIGETNVGGSLARTSQAAQILTVRTTTLADALGGADRPFSLVCDIEGAEWDLFEQEGDLVAQAKLVVMELHDRSERRGEGWRDLLATIAGDPRYDVIDSYGPVVVFRGAVSGHA